MTRLQFIRVKFYSFQLLRVGTVSSELREASVGIQELKKCADKYSLIGGKLFTDNLLCAAAPGKDTCQVSYSLFLSIKGFKVNKCLFQEIEQNDYELMHLG